jgi:hypothetical protein
MLAKENSKKTARPPAQTARKQGTCCYLTGTNDFDGLDYATRARDVRSALPRMAAPL